LRQNDQMLMPVQLPNELVIADAGRVQIRNCTEILEASLNSTDVIAPPTSLRSRVNGPAEDREPVTSNLACQGRFNRMWRGKNGRECLRNLYSWRPFPQIEVLQLLP
jgi:hypothetical protein